MDDRKLPIIASNERRAADPFFEQLQALPAGSRTDAAALAIEARRHRRIVRTPRLADARGDDQKRRTAADGGDDARQREPARRAGHRAAAPVAGSGRSRTRGSRRGLPIPRTRIAASPLLGAASAVIVAGAALAAIVGGGGNHMLAAKQLATKQPSASSSHCAGLTDPAELLRSCPRAFERPAPDP
jgi:hypothetical protein